MTALIAGFIIGSIAGVLAQDAYDIAFHVERLWGKFNEWRKG